MPSLTNHIKGSRAHLVLKKMTTKRIWTRAEIVGKEPSSGVLTRLVLRGYVKKEGRNEYLITPDGVEVLVELNNKTERKKDENGKIKTKRDDIKKGKEYRQKWREQGCFVCRELNPICIDAHHIDRMEKNDVYFLSKRGGIEIMKKELDKCIPLCKNCHAKIHNKQFSLLPFPPGNSKI